METLGSMVASLVFDQYMFVMLAVNEDPADTYARNQLALMSLRERERRARGAAAAAQIEMADRAAKAGAWVRHG